MAKEQLNPSAILSDPIVFITSMPQDGAATFDFQSELTKLLAEGNAIPERVAELTQRAAQISEQASILGQTTRKVMRQEGEQTVVVQEEMGFSIGQAVAAMRLLGKAY